MFLKILLIILAIPIIILPFASSIKENKKWTKSGKWLCILIILFAFVQILNECNNKKEENRLIENNNQLQNRIDSLTNITLILQKTLQSIDSQFYNTNKTLFVLGKTNDSLNLKILESDRPIIHLVSSKIVSDQMTKNKYIIDFTFMNDGKRSATNVFGKAYTSRRDTIWKNGTLNLNRTDIFTNGKGFSITFPMSFNPDSTTLENPIFYYFTLSYTDLVVKTIYLYEIAMKMDPFKKSNFPTELSLCRDWERVKIKNMINN